MTHILPLRPSRRSPPFSPRAPPTSSGLLRSCPISFDLRRSRRISSKSLRQRQAARANGGHGRRAAGAAKARRGSSRSTAGQPPPRGRRMCIDHSSLVLHREDRPLRSAGAAGPRLRGPADRASGGGPQRLAFRPRRAGDARRATDSQSVGPRFNPGRRHHLSISSRVAVSAAPAASGRRRQTPDAPAGRDALREKALRRAGARPSAAQGYGGGGARPSAVPGRAPSGQPL